MSLLRVVPPTKHFVVSKAGLRPALRRQTWVHLSVQGQPAPQSEFQDSPGHTGNPVSKKQKQERKRKKEEREGKKEKKTEERRLKERRKEERKEGRI